MSRELGPCAPRRPARRVFDWQLAAELLAQGMTIAEAAARVGCSCSALARRRRRDSIFQSCIARPRAATAEAEPPRIDELRPVLQKAIANEVGVGNVRVVLWLADRLKLVTPPNEQTPEQELRRLLAGLTTEDLREFESLRDEP